MSNHSRIDAFIAATNADVCQPDLVAPAAAAAVVVEGVVPATVRMAERRLSAVADPGLPILHDDLIYIHNGEYAADSQLAIRRHDAVKRLLVRRGVAGGQVPGIEICNDSNDNDGQIRTRFQYLGAGVINGVTHLAMGKRMTHVLSSGVLGGREYEILVLNTRRGLEPLLEDGNVPGKTVAMFGEYAELARQDGFRVRS